MASEARRGLIRILSNYGRLLVTVVLGLVLVRVLLQQVGNDAWGLIALLGSTAGLAAMLQEIVASSMIRELGEAHHLGDDRWFRKVYSSALLLSGAVAVVSTVAMAVLWLCVPLLEIPSDDLVRAGRWLVACKAVESIAIIVLAAPVNMYKVTERMVSHNVWLVLFRATALAAALSLIVLQPANAAEGVIMYATVWSTLAIAVRVVQSIVITVVDRRLVPAPRLVRRAAIRRIVKIGGWNTAVSAALSLHLRLDNLLMNLFIGLGANVWFGLARQLTAYVRMLSTGMTDGLDAVSARISTAGTDQSLRSLVHHSTRLHGLIALPAGLGMMLLAEPILTSWVGTRIEDPAATVPPTVTLIRIMTAGMVFRSIGDAWIGIMYGAGHVAKYAPAVLVGGLVNPVLAILLFWLLPEPVEYTGAIWSFSIIFLVVHFMYVPWQTGRTLGIGLRGVLAPLIRPLIATAICSPIVIAAARATWTWNLWLLLAVIGAFGIVYAVVSTFVVMDAAERRRFGHAALRRLPFQKPQRSAGRP